MLLLFLVCFLSLVVCHVSFVNDLSLVVCCVLFFVGRWLFVAVLVICKKTASALSAVVSGRGSIERLRQPCVPGGKAFVAATANKEHDRALVDAGHPCRHDLSYSRLQRIVFQ